MGSGRKPRGSNQGGTSWVAGDAAGGATQAHGLVKVRKPQPQLAPVAAHAQHPPGLVGGEQRGQTLVAVWLGIS